MTRSEEIAALFLTTAQARGPNFTCYTERDGGPWYVIAGDRESWHGAERVADTETRNRDNARAFALFLMGVTLPGYEFALIPNRSRRQSIEFTCNGTGNFVAWRDACGRAFPDFSEES